MNQIKMLSTALIMSSKLSPSAIERSFKQRKIKASDALHYTNTENLKMAAVQLELREYNTLDNYIDHMQDLVRQAAEGGAQLVSFPEYTGLLPIMISPLFRQVAEDCISHLRYEELGPMMEGISFFKEHLSDLLFNCFYNTFALLANRYHLYIQAGSTLIYSRGKLYERSFLFDPEGEVILEQDKLTLSEREQCLGLAAGEDLEVASTPLGKISVLLGNDSFQFEPAKLAHGLGAQILLCPVAPRCTESIAPHCCGPLMRCQERMLFSVVSCLVGSFGGFDFRAQSGLFGPYAAARLPSGVCMQSNNTQHTSVVVGRFNLSRLHPSLDLYTSDTNPAIYAQLEAAYRNLQVPPPKSNPS